MNIVLIEELTRYRAAFQLLKEIIKKAESESVYSDGRPYKDLDIDRDAIKYVFLVAGESDREVDVPDLEKEGVDVCTTQDE